MSSSGKWMTRGNLLYLKKNDLSCFYGAAVESSFNVIGDIDVKSANTTVQTYASC